MTENYNFGLPIAASTYAEKIDFSLSILHWAMAIIFVVASIFMAYTLIRFRKSAHPNADPNVNKWHVRSFIPDTTILIFEIILIFILGLPIWAQIKNEFPMDNQSNVVELVAEQFAWGFQYAGVDDIFGKKDPKQISAGNTIGIDESDPASADDIVSLNILHVPIGKPTIVYMTSKDVIHNFFVPEFRVKQDIVPGMKIPLWFEPTQLGEFELVCSQLCGLGHYRMMGKVIVHTEEDFQAKLKELKAEAQSGDENL